MRCREFVRVKKGFDFLNVVFRNSSTSLAEVVRKDGRLAAYHAQTLGLTSALNKRQKEKSYENLNACIADFNKNIAGRTLIGY